MKWMSKLNKPWLHFIVLGIVFFKLQGALFPEPKTVIGPLSEARISALQQQWYASTGQQLSPQQSARLIALELDRDMLLQRALELDFHLHDTIVYQRLIRNMNFLQLAQGKSETELFHEALEMRLHLDDTVIKRRLIQLMENQLLADNRPAKPTTAQIAAEFANRSEELRRPPRYSIEHIFFNRERESAAPSVIASITQQKLDIKAVRYLSSLFLQGYQFTRETPGQLAQKFGRSFVLSLEQAKPKSQQWLGPIRSIFGLHYVWVSAVEPAHDARLEEVEQQLRNDLEYAAQAQALQNAIAALRDDYDVKGLHVKGLDLEDPDVAGLDVSGRDEKGLASKTKEVRR